MRQEINLKETKRILFNNQEVKILKLNDQIIWEVQALLPPEIIGFTVGNNTSSEFAVVNKNTIPVYLHIFDKTANKELSFTYRNPKGAAKGVPATVDKIDVVANHCLTTQIVIDHESDLIKNHPLEFYFTSGEDTSNKIIQTVNPILSLMPIEDVFTITGRGTVATGRIESGRFDIGNNIWIIGMSETIQKTKITSIEMFHKLVDYAVKGDNVGMLCQGIQKTDIERGQIIINESDSNAIQLCTKILAQFYIYTAEEGGRHTPFFDGYKPQFYFRTIDITGTITVPAEIPMVMPGTFIDLTFELTTPVGLKPGDRFAVREGGRSVASGIVKKILR